MQYSWATGETTTFAKAGGTSNATLDLETDCCRDIILRDPRHRLRGAPDLIARQRAGSDVALRRLRTVSRGDRMGRLRLRPRPDRALWVDGHDRCRIRARG